MLAKLRQIPDIAKEIGDYFLYPLKIKRLFLLVIIRVVDAFHECFAVVDPHVFLLVVTHACFVFVATKLQK